MERRSDRYHDIRAAVIGRFTTGPSADAIRYASSRFPEASKYRLRHLERDAGRLRCMESASAGDALSHRLNNIARGQDYFDPRDGPVRPQRRTK